MFREDVARKGGVYLAAPSRGADAARMLRGALAAAADTVLVGEGGILARALEICERG